MNFAYTLSLARKPRMLLRLALGRLFRRYNWQGIAVSGEAFPDRPADGFNSDQWLQPLRLSSLEVLRFYEEQNAYGPGTNPHAALSLLASTIGESQGQVTIVDVGGGLGTSFVSVKANTRATLDFHVVEIDQLARLGNEMFKNHGGIRFHVELPQLNHVDIGYVSTALQYFKDFREVVQRLKTYQPKYLVFAKLSAGEVPTFWAWQMNVEGHKIPYWFINLKDLKTLLDDDYDIIFDEKIPNDYNMNNFPATHRLATFRNIVFAKKTLKAAAQ